MAEQNQKVFYKQDNKILYKKGENMKFIKTMLFYLAVTVCTLLVIYGICNSALKRQITNTGELVIFDEVYTCQYKGQLQ